MPARCVWLGVAISALVAAGCEPAKRDPLPILRAAAKEYAGLRTYYFAERTVLTPSDGSPARTVDSVVAGAPEGKSRYEMLAPFGKVIGVSDGNTDWIFYPSVNQYQEGVGGSLPFAGMGRSFISSYSRLDSDIVSATWLRVESLTMGTESHECDVILVVQQAGRPMVDDPEADRLWRAEWTGVPKTYWIDRRHRILRELSVSPKGGRIETSRSIVRMNEDLPADLFISPVPSGASKANAPG